MTRIPSSSRISLGILLVLLLLATVTATTTTSSLRERNHHHHNTVTSNTTLSLGRHRELQGDINITTEEINQNQQSQPLSEDASLLNELIAIVLPLVNAGIAAVTPDPLNLNIAGTLPIGSLDFGCGTTGLDFTYNWGGTCKRSTVGCLFVSMRVYKIHFREGIHFQTSIRNSQVLQTLTVGMLTILSLLTYCRYYGLVHIFY